MYCLKILEANPIFHINSFFRITWIRIGIFPEPNYCIVMQKMPVLYISMISTLGRLALFIYCLYLNIRTKKVINCW